MSQINQNYSQNNITYSKRGQNEQNIYSEQNNSRDVPGNTQANEEGEWGARPGNSDEQDNKNLNNQESLLQKSPSQFGNNSNQNLSEQMEKSKLYKYAQKQSQKSEDVYCGSNSKITDNGEYPKSTNVSNVKNDIYNPYNSNMNNNNNTNENNNMINNDSQNIIGVHNSQNIIGENNIQYNNNGVKIDNNYKNINSNNINLNDKNININNQINNLNKENNSSSSSLKHNASNNNYMYQNNNNNINQSNQINSKMYDNDNYKKQTNSFNSNYNNNFNNQYNNNVNMKNISSQNIPNNNFQNNPMNEQMPINSNSLPNDIYMKKQNSYNNNYPNNNFMNNNSNNIENLTGNENKNINYNNNINISNQNMNNIMNQGNISSNNNIMNIQNNPNINSNQNIPNQYQNNSSQNKILAELNKFSFSRKFQPTKTGLINLVDTSYLNAVLQLIGNIDLFVNYFLNPKHTKGINDDIRHKPLSFVIHRLFLHLYPEIIKEGKEKYKPDSIKLVLGQLNSVYNSIKKRNPNELLSFILDTLHNELNIAKNNNNQFLNPDITDKTKVIKIVSQNFGMSYNSIISNNLNWFEIKETKCTTCNTSFFNLNTFNTFELDIVGTYQIKNNPITILDCLQYYIMGKPQFLICKQCKNNSKFMKNTKIYCSPRYFVFSLDRKNLDNSLLQIPFLVDEKINIYNFLENKGAPSQYQLTGIISYCMNYKKYISFCLCPIDNQWYTFDDENIQLTQINEVINSHNNNNFIPCILVYKS